MKQSKDVSVKISRKHFEALKLRRKKTRLPIKTTIEMAIEAAIEDGR